MKKEYDFTKGKKVEKTTYRPKVPVTIRLDAGLVAAIKDEAERTGLPYQSLINSILHRYIQGDFSEVARDKKRA